MRIRNSRFSPKSRNFAFVTSLYVDIHTHKAPGDFISPRTAGIHPWQAAPGAAAALRPLPEGVQAVGEIGLDFACAVPRAVQEACFVEQLALACEAGLPVVLHCVRAFEAVMRRLAEYPPRAAIFHGFIGSAEQARQAVARGHYLSFGERTFASPRTVEALRTTPPERLFVETDTSAAPIGTICARIAALKGMDTETLRRATVENYERIFGNGQLA